VWSPIAFSRHYLNSGPFPDFRASLSERERDRAAGSARTLALLRRPVCASDWRAVRRVELRSLPPPVSVRSALSRGGYGGGFSHGKSIARPSPLHLVVDGLETATLVPHMVDGEQVAKIALYGLALAGIFGGVAFTARFLASQVPAQVQKAARDAVSRVYSCEQRIEQIELRVTSWKAEIDGLLDQVDEALQRTEKKRARTSASESRMALAAEPPPTTRNEIVEAGRRKVYFTGQPGG